MLSGKTISIQTKLAASFQQLHRNKTKVDKHIISWFFFFIYASCEFLQPITSFYPFLKLQNAALVFFKEPVNYAVYIRLSNSIP